MDEPHARDGRKGDLRGQADRLRVRRVEVDVEQRVERGPDRLEPQRDRIGDAAADDGRDERARPWPWRDSVPQSVESAGDRRRRETDQVARDDEDPVAEERDDRGGERRGAGCGARLEDNREGHERHAADQRPERREQKHDAEEGRPKGPGRFRIGHRASAFRPARMSVEVSAPSPSSPEALATAAAACAWA